MTAEADVSKMMAQKDGTTRDLDPRREPLRSAESREPRIERIARRAHELYEARGGTDGRALEDWLQAEREIDAES